MGWKATCAMEERFRFVEDWKRDEESVAEVCRRYGVSRQTGYKWIVRYREGGLAALEDRSRARLTHPNQVVQEVEDALVAVTTAAEQVTAQEKQVKALQSALHLSNLRYTGGIANYLDVLIAQRNLFDAELSLASTRRLHLVSVVQLYKALGGGWSPTPVTANTVDQRPTQKAALK